MNHQQMLNLEQSIRGNLSTAFQLFRSGRRLMYQEHQRLRGSQSVSQMGAEFARMKDVYNHLDFQAVAVSSLSS